MLLTQKSYSREQEKINQIKNANSPETEIENFD